MKLDPGHEEGYDCALQHLLVKREKSRRLNQPVRWKVEIMHVQRDKEDVRGVKNGLSLIYPVGLLCL